MSIYCLNIFIQLLVIKQLPKILSSTPVQMSQYTSTTLIPNIFHLNSYTSIGDMAGYFDKNDYIGAIGASYFLKMILKQAKQIKFVMVLDQMMLKENSGKGIVKTFQQFINMFKFNEMTQQIKSNLKSSLSIVITRSQSKIKHLAYLKMIVKKLADPKLIIKEKIIIIQLIDSIIQEDRIEIFKAARVDVSPEQCVFQERLNKKGWKYFDIATEKCVKQQIVNLPISVQFQRIDDLERQKFYKAIKKRIQQQTQFVVILCQALKLMKENYRHFSSQNPQKLAKTFMRQLLDFSSIFHDVKAYLDANDHYNTSDFIKRKEAMPFEKANFVNSVKCMTKVYSITNKIYNCEQVFIENMESYRLFFGEFVGCLLPLCSTTNEQHSLQRLKFCLERGFQQFSELFPIDESTVIQAYQIIKDFCNSSFFQEEQWTLSFLQPWTDKKFLIRLFKTQRQIEEAEQFFNLCCTKIKQIELQNQSEILFENSLLCLQIRINLLLLVANNCSKNDEKLKALSTFIRVFEDLQKFILSQQNLQQDGKQLQITLTNLQKQKLLVIYKIIDMLLQFNSKEKTNTKQFALNIAQHIRDVHKSCQIFEIMLDQSFNKVEVAGQKQEKQSNVDIQLQILTNFSEYCRKWGRVEKAIELLQRRMSIENQYIFADQDQQTVNTLVGLVNDKLYQNTFYQQYLKQLQNKSLVPENSLTMLQLILKIKRDILQQV